MNRVGAVELWSILVASLETVAEEYHPHLDVQTRLTVWWIVNGFGLP